MLFAGAHGPVEEDTAIQPVIARKSHMTQGPWFSLKVTLLVPAQQTPDTVVFTDEGYSRIIEGLL